MKREFKFRHADEIAGTFVICAVALFVIGIVLAGRSQGWFEGKFSLNVVFKTAEGSFGLQEGAVVQVRNTVAGRVGKIAPIEGGMMGTTLILKERFRPFITKDSVAKVKKKFGVAGDAYVEVDRGRERIVEDDDTIECVKDEELMETAQKMLAELETTLLPMFEETEKIVGSVSAILESIKKGEGIAGAVVSDPQLRDDLTQIVSHLEAIADEAEVAVSQAGTLLTNEVNSIVGDVTAMAGQTRALLSNDVGRIVSDVHTLQDEVVKTLRESRRLIGAFQRHWLFRKYVKQDSGRVALVPSALSMMAEPGVQEALEASLAKARAADDVEAIARDAYNLAVCRLAAGEKEQAEILNTEARLASRTAGVSPAAPYLLDAELLRISREFEDAEARVGDAMGVLGRTDVAETKVEAQILLAAIRVDADAADGAVAALDKAERFNRKLEQPQFSAAIKGLRADIALQRGDHEQAARAFRAQANHLRDVPDISGMVNALRRAGDAYMAFGNAALAAEYYYRAASSLAAQGEQDEAVELLAMAAPAAEGGDDKLLVKRIAQLSGELK
jgi:phospholipid/cholesterol/gamma-HCH transport system substrate-binding protein